jgi:Ca2+/H+ antiporter
MDDGSTLVVLLLLAGLALVAGALYRHAAWCVAALLGFMCVVMATRFLLVTAVLRARGAAPAKRAKARWGIRPS